MNQKFEDLCYACRVGDLEDAQRLITAGVNPNAVDSFDNTPLFLASLCGHESVVRLLLRSGASCDRDRYEGARCIYGALTDSIRDLLIQHDVSKAVDLAQPFATHLSSLFRDPFVATDDLTVTGHESVSAGKEFSCFKLHRFLLSARSQKLKSLLANEWSALESVPFPIYMVSDKILIIILKYFYLIPVLHEIGTNLYDDVIQIANWLNLSLLSASLDKLKHLARPDERANLIVEFQVKFNDMAREDLRLFVNDKIILNSVLLPSTGMEQHVLRKVVSDFKTKGIYPDIYILITNKLGEQRLYPCHLSILLRSDYFKLMFENGFQEFQYYYYDNSLSYKDNRNYCPIISLPPCDFSVFDIILRYFYYDEVDILWNHSIDVLILADYLQDNRLKSMATVCITKSKEILDNYSILDLLLISWAVKMERLEHFCAKYLAMNLSNFIKLQEFKDAILLSSKRISSRQETDTIELVDDIKYYLLEKYSLELEDVDYFNELDLDFQKSSGFLDYKNDIRLLEDLLTSLNLFSER
ncbi:hypothetical protein TBLA_0J01770 [Henningerozyma blattae CBS 6284]|uniref:BTB domain-containing protein n=1 Tax=Henningerozyma blattae (strain ATCC 34711 / CBS 6284 / DSM 70876 / NBRC 10599 / NRRL Y-10934 / UCD 77-7) TaxID=1071380 RepID=I2H9W9_HENB6|nr:hypothetical protein TBLA_0J01770 [Tetrapisispora blattae CBS 6284]CCH63171.1 hypothetical protein TBLA_0J01770 [Tetrapisispora blattae CBS 6284]